MPISKTKVYHEWLVYEPDKTPLPVKWLIGITFHRRQFNMPTKSVILSPVAVSLITLDIGFSSLQSISVPQHHDGIVIAQRYY